MEINLDLSEWLILAVASWRLAYLLVRERGPFMVLAKMRTHTSLGGLLNCIACVSLWCAFALLGLWLTPLRLVVYALAISGAGLMLASWSGVEFER